jgi:hypothetical protein
VIVSIRIVIFDIDWKHIGKIALCEIFLVIFFDGVIEFMEGEFVTSMIGIQELLSMLTRQI